MAPAISSRYFPIFPRSSRSLVTKIQLFNMEQEKKGKKELRRSSFETRGKLWKNFEFLSKEKKKIRKKKRSNFLNNPIEQRRGEEF